MDIRAYFRPPTAGLDRSTWLHVQRHRWVAWVVLPLAAVISFVAISQSQSEAPNIPPVALSTIPLFASATSDKPTMALALSVEYPTVGAQYVKTANSNTDDSYSNTNEYLGYYDAESCYTYNNTPTEAVVAPKTLADFKRFDRTGSATNRMCTNAFSGNFLNWATSSAIDMLRLALTGGDRYIDTPTLTILQRAVLPNGNPICMWNSTNFPAKQLKRSGAGNTYFGAVPSAMTTAAIAAGNKDIWVANTLNRVYFSTANAGGCTNTGSYTLGNSISGDVFLYSRVQVCNASSGVLQDSRDYDFCQKYPSGNYKPGGVIQKYSDQLRLAAFGYLLDQTASYDTGGRYGGVLRAPMKFVGGKTFDINGVDNTPATGNPKGEWDLSTGVFNVNPESDTTFGKSGVINYLNQFGRTGTVGLYKKYDPIGELHYETLRYLQGLQPSADATKNITSGMYDGFPAITTWVDPYADGRSSSGDYSCLKSNIVVIGDVNTHDGNRLPATNIANNVPDINLWRSVVQNFEKKISANYTDGQGVSRTTTNPNPANTGVPSATGTSQIMGSAYWAHTHDIRGVDWTASPDAQRPGLRVKTFTFDVNEYAAQNDVTTRRKKNQLFMAAKYGGFEADPSNTSGAGGTTAPFNTWGNPFKEDDGTDNKYVWEDASTAVERQGEANTYYLQSNARAVLKAFDEIFKRGGETSRSIAGGAIRSKDLSSTAANTIYQAAFDIHDWSGDVLAFPITVTAATATPPNVVSIDTTPTWTASTKLAALSAPATSRKIVVGKVGATANPVATQFTWSAIEAGLQNNLNKPSPNVASDGLGEDRLKYLRGDSSKEGTTAAKPFRVRNNKLLGDIVNSGVVYSGAPTANIRSSTYPAFYASNVSRAHAVFVGANDGMLHAFDATDGEELFAYIPSWMGPKLSALTSPAYVNSHQNYVDATPVVGEAETDSGWKTVLVSGTGGGGQGVFALDVTKPSLFDEGDVMWEFTHADDLDMGNVVGRPQILKLRTSAPSASTQTYKWFAVVGSGVNNYTNSNIDGEYSTGAPTLFLLDLSKSVGAAWQLGTNYYKISLPVDSVLSASVATGLINFKAALGINGEVTQVYLGNLHGELWKLDFSKFGSADWTIGNLSSFNKGSSATPIPMFVAMDDTGAVQPITMAPTIVYGALPGTTNIVFGTGKYLEASDKNSTAIQSMYMIYDNGTGVVDSNPVGVSAISGRPRLQEGAVTTGAVTFPSFTLGRATVDDDSTQRSGWFFDFVEAREREIASGVVTGEYVTFASLIPGSSGSTGTCTAPGGSGNEYFLDIASGNGSSRRSTVGLLGYVLQSELVDATSTISDNTGKRTKTVKIQKFQQGSDGISTPTTSDTVTMIAGRLSWRQINNYQDLKNATAP